MTDSVQTQEQPTITLDDKTYIVADLSEGAKYCLQQIQDLQQQSQTARARVDQITMAENGFLNALREEVKKQDEEPTAE